VDEVFDEIKQKNKLIPCGSEKLQTDLEYIRLV
jgi:hypothetical protein